MANRGRVVRVLNHPGFNSKKFLIVTLLSGIGITGCFQGTGVITKSAISAAIQKQSQNCAIPGTAAVKNISQKLAAAGTVVGPDFCTKIENYSCYRRVFSPTLSDGQTTADECAKVPELGGTVCMKFESRNYSTLEASKLSDTPASSTQPGGEFNRSEYVCHQKDLKDGDDYLAVGEGGQFGEALVEAHSNCTKVAPRLGE